MYSIKLILFSVWVIIFTEIGIMLIKSSFKSFIEKDKTSWCFLIMEFLTGLCSIILPVFFILICPFGEKSDKMLYLIVSIVVGFLPFLFKKIKQKFKDISIKGRKLF